MTLRTLFVNPNVAISRLFDSLLPRRFRIDGYRHFVRETQIESFGEGITIVDVGGGRHPFAKFQFPEASKFQKWKERSRVRYVGIDISEAELAAAPSGYYDETHVADLSDPDSIENLKINADHVLCVAVMEHVRDAAAGLRSLAGLVRRDGKIYLFVPCRNAAFARLNLLLPQGLKRTLLFSLFPDKRTDSGFPSYYDRCTIGEFRSIGSEIGMETTRSVCYYESAYFTFFAPLHVVWRLTAAFLVWWAPERFCETYAMVMRRIR